jgi:hypothetical protein
MLGQLDTFIAFGVIILGVSMLITVLNQMVTALLGMRGTNLRWGIATLIEQTDPRLAGDARRAGKGTCTCSASWPPRPSSVWAHHSGSRR